MTAMVRDLLSGVITDVGVDSRGQHGSAAEFVSWRTAMSNDGYFVAFNSRAGLVPDDRNAVDDVYVREWRPMLLTSIEPIDGSESGGDLVTIRGRGFTTVTDTIVTFGGTPGSIAEVRPDRVSVRTPSGLGVVDVAVRSSVGLESLAASFTFVAPELASRYGNVNVALGLRESVLLVNGVSGASLDRVTSLRVGTPIDVVVLSPSSRPEARFAMYGWPGAPTPATLTAVPRGIGVIGFPIPATGGAPQPSVVFNNAGHRRALGSPTLPFRAAPTVLVHRSRGARSPGIVTLQGLIQDNGSASALGWSVTNAVVLDIAR